MKRIALRLCPWTAMEFIAAQPETMNLIVQPEVGGKFGVYDMDAPASKLAKAYRDEVDREALPYHHRNFLLKEVN
jgi:hypothetical protein